MHRFDPTKLHKLISAERDDWLQPRKVLSELSLAPMLNVIDFGSGPGYFTLPIAERVGENGSVIALDVEPAMLTALMQRATTARIFNISAVLSDAQNIPIANTRIDRALLSLILHEIEDQSRLLSEIKRILKPTGQIVIVEWQPWQTEHGPAPNERIAPEALISEVNRHGLTPLNQIPLGTDCYALVVRHSS